MCGTFNTYEIYFDYYEETLGKEILRRRTSGNYFTESELWEIMGSTLEALQHLNESGVSHGFLNIHTVYLSNREDYSVLLSDFGFLTG